MENLQPIDADQNSQNSLGVHPVKALLESVGIDVSKFPIVKFVIESKVKDLRLNRLCIPLRLSTAPGHVFETFFRITRIIEIPSSAGPHSHRRFLEIEWSLEREPFLEKDMHPANSFLASEMSCPGCRSHFTSDPQIQNDSTVRVSCPQCLQAWTFKIDSDNTAGKDIPLLSDLFFKDILKAEELVELWESRPIEPTDAYYYNFFPFHFDKLEFSNSLEMIFGDSKAWSAMTNSTHTQFESLIKGFINHLYFEYVKTESEVSNASELDKTDIQFKLPQREFMQGDTFISGMDGEDDLPLRKRQENTVRQDPVQFKWNVESLSHKKIASRPASKTSTTSQVTVGLAISVIVFVGFFLFSKLSAPKVELNTTANLQSEANQRVEQSVVEDAKSQMGITPNQAEEISTKEIKSTQNAPTQAQVIAEKQIEKSPSEEFKKKDLALKSAKEQSRAVAKELRKSLSEEEELPKLPSAETEETLRSAKIEAAYRQGMLHLKLQQGKAAVAQFQNVLKIDPLHAGSYRGLGLAQIYDQRFDQAIKSFEKYLSIAVTDDNDRTQVQELIDALRERAKLASANH